MRSKRMIVILCCFCLCPGFSISSGLFQENGKPKFGVRVNVVSVDVEVLDRADNPVTGLTEKDFVVLENNQKMEITNFNILRNHPVSLAILLDTSTLEREKLLAAKDYILDIVHLLAHGDDICLLTFDQKDVYLNTGFTTDRPTLTRSLEDVYVPSKRPWSFFTEFFGSDPPTGLGIDRALRYLRESAHDKKALLVISNRFRGLGPATVEHVQKSDCTFYTLVFEHRMTAVATMGGSDINLEQMEENTGGREFPAVTGDIMGISHRIAFTLKNYYSIGYRTEIETKDSGARKIKVLIPGRDYIINARRSYSPQ